MLSVPPETHAGVRSWLRELNQLSAVDLATDTDLPTATAAAEAQYLDAPEGGPYNLFLAHKPQPDSGEDTVDTPLQARRKGCRAALRATVALGRRVQRPPRRKTAVETLLQSPDSDSEDELDDVAWLRRQAKAPPALATSSCRHRRIDRFQRAWWRLEDPRSASRAPGPEERVDSASLAAVQTRWKEVEQVSSARREHREEQLRRQRVVCTNHGACCCPPGAKPPSAAPTPRTVQPYLTSARFGLRAHTVHFTGPHQRSSVTMHPGEVLQLVLGGGGAPAGSIGGVWHAATETWRVGPLTSRKRLLPAPGEERWGRRPSSFTLPDPTGQPGSAVHPRRRRLVSNPTVFTFTAPTRAPVGKCLLVARCLRGTTTGEVFLKVTIAPQRTPTPPLAAASFEEKLAAVSSPRTKMNTAVDTKEPDPEPGFRAVLHDKEVQRRSLTRLEQMLADAYADVDSEAQSQQLEDEILANRLDTAHYAALEADIATGLEGGGAESSGGEVVQGVGTGVTWLDDPRRGETRSEAAERESGLLESQEPLEPQEEEHDDDDDGGGGEEEEEEEEEEEPVFTTEFERLTAELAKQAGWPSYEARFDDAWAAAHQWTEGGSDGGDDDNGGGGESQSSTAAASKQKVHQWWQTMLVEEVTADAELELILKPGVREGKWSRPPPPALGVGVPTRDWKADWVDPETGRTLAPEERNWEAKWQDGYANNSARDWEDFTTPATPAALPRSAASGRIVLLHVSGGPKCEPSQASRRLFGQLAGVHSNDDICFAATKLSSCPGLASGYGVVATPTILVFDGATLLDEFSGSQLLEPALQRRHGGQRLKERGVLGVFLEDSLSAYYNDVPKTVAREILEDAFCAAAGGSDAVPRLVMGEIFGTLLRRIDKEARMSLASSKWPK